MFFFFWVSLVQYWQSHGVASSIWSSISISVCSLETTVCTTWKKKNGLHWMVGCHRAVSIRVSDWSVVYYHIWYESYRFAQPRNASGSRWEVLLAGRAVFAPCLIPVIRLLLDWSSYSKGGDADKEIFKKTGRHCALLAVALWYLSNSSAHRHRCILSLSALDPYVKSRTMEVFFSLGLDQGLDATPIINTCETLSS